MTPDPTVDPTADATADATAGSGELPPGYRAIALLARGRRTETWDAWDEARACRVVVKQLRADRLAAADPAEAERLRRAVLVEGEILTTLAHPHLVRGLEALDLAHPAVVMETVTGATLDAVVEDAPLGLADAALLGQQLASVLGWLHRHAWLHLDVKPGNVVVEAGRAVLVDLGLAARPGAGRPGAGTRGYLAPEQARGSGLSAATDVWGLGVTLLESLTGELPFGAEATWDSRRRPPWRRAPVAPRAVPADLPAEVADLLRGCVALDPAARPRLVDVRAVLATVAPEA